jgi:hypothetical protein
MPATPMRIGAGTSQAARNTTNLYLEKHRGAMQQLNRELNELIQNLSQEPPIQIEFNVHQALCLVVFLQRALDRGFLRETMAASAAAVFTENLESRLVEIDPAIATSLKAQSTQDYFDGVFDDVYDDDDPVVLYDEVDGAIRDSELRQICDIVAAQRFISVLGILKQDAEPLRTIFPSGTVPLVHLTAFQPQQLAPPCYLMDSSLVGEDQMVAIAVWLKDSNPNELATVEDAIAYIRQGLPLKCEWFDHTTASLPLLVEYPPTGLPLNWQDETSGTLESSIKKYLNDDSSEEKITQDDIERIKSFFWYYINAPCWDKSPSFDLTPLKRSVRLIYSAEDISDCLRQFFEIGLDPL